MKRTTVAFITAAVGALALVSCNQTLNGPDTAPPEPSPAATATATPGPSRTPIIGAEDEVIRGGATPTPTPTPTEDAVPREYRSALGQAESFSETFHMSKEAIRDQLTSEYGGQFSAEAADYAVDNVAADWNANALESARSYQETMNMSPEAIRDQLTSEYGGQFTAEQADYAVTELANE